jgi:hypothetical protein
VRHNSAKIEAPASLQNSYKSDTLWGVWVMARWIRVNGQALARVLEFLVAKAQSSDRLPAGESEVRKALLDASRLDGEGFSQAEVRRLLAGTTVPDDPAGTAISQILYYLVKRFRRELRLGETMSEAISVISQRTEIAEANLEKIFTGETHNPTTTLERIRGVFADAWPELKVEWLRERSLDDFFRVAGIGAGVQRRSLRTGLATFHPNEDRLRAQLCGVYICYRFAFQADDGKVCREVLHVYEAGGQLFWSMSSDQDGTILVFHGEVLPMGGTLLLVGSYAVNRRTSDGTSVPVVERGRGIVLYDDTDHYDMRNQRIGLVESTTSAKPHDPCGACVVAVRVDGELGEADIAHLMKRVTVIRHYDELVMEDFRSEDPDDPYWVMAFIDNRLAGSIATPEPGADNHDVDSRIARWQRPRQVGRRDQTARIDVRRFYDHMPKIVDRARNDSKNKAPFKRETVAALLSRTGEEQ